MPHRGVVFLMLPIAASMLRGQVYTSERHRLLPDVTHNRVAAGDFDGDGDADLATLSSSQLQIVRNDGQGRFMLYAAVFPMTGAAIAAGDIDGDGDLDLAIGQPWFFAYGPGRLLRNDGPLGFTDVSSQWTTTNEGTSDLLFVDFDGDGDLDIVTADGPNSSYQLGQPQPFNHLYLNNGAGFFTDFTQGRMPNAPTGNRAVTAGDIDTDGDVDLVFAGNVCRVFVQNAGSVAMETPGRVPSLLPSTSTYTDVDLADIDLDGDRDLLASSDQGVHVFVNNGLGFFSLAATIAEPSVQGMHVRDFDGDARVDLLAVRGTWLLFDVLPLQLWRNTPAGFVDVTTARLEAPGLAPRAVHVFDADADGDLDVWGSASPQPVLWHNDGQGRLLQLSTRDLSNTLLVFASVADIDADGDVDVAGIEAGSSVSSDATQVLVAANDGEGPIAAPVVVLPRDPVRRSSCLAWIDVDQDGDLDLFVGDRSNSRDLLLHNVAGTFVDVTAAQMPAVAGTTVHFASGDVDGDGIVDLATAGYVAHLYRGTGAGGFTDASAVLPALPNTSGVALLDYDQDGDLDVAHSLASWAGNGGLRVLRNNWPAPFVDVTASLALPSLQAWAVVTIDIDRDGRRDLLVGNASGNGLVLLRAVGAGFVDETALRLPTVLQPIASIVVLDFDGDGWPDIACRDRWGGMPQELRNTAGVLAVVPNPFTLFGGSLPRHPAAADFDGDGDQDLITAFGLLENRVRDLHSTAPPRLGRNGELVLRAHAGDGVNPQLAALFIAAAPASPPLPLPGLGTLRLDPATAAFHSMHTISATGGEVSFVYLVPAVPALLGSVVYAQALFVHEPNPATWRLGNMVRLPVRL